MSDQSKQAKSTDPRVQAALREYLERIDRGEVVNRDEFLSRHSEIADALRSFFAAEEPLRKIAATKIPNESAAISTQSIAAQAQETVLPRRQPDGSLGTTGSGLAGTFGRYQILRALGKGAMGAVYLAQDTQLKRHVAIKTPHLEEDPTGEVLKRFYREAEAAATLRHANICPIYDVGEIDGKHFLSMAYIEGRPLSDLIKSGKPQNERHILIALYKLARALQQAHDHGIVHRDLKPANIMVDKQGDPIIMDFGLARKRRAEGEASLTHSGVILGSPAYMSPEQIEGDPEIVGPASDQYSLGVVLYEMLTSQLPFRGSVANVLAQIITKGPTRPSELRAGLDPRIEAVCLRMMAKKASDRFPSMKAVADQLAAIVKNPAPASAGPASSDPAANSAASSDPAANSAASSNPAANGAASSNTAPIAAEKSLTASRPPAGRRPSGVDGGASPIGQSLNQRSISPSDVTSLEELVRKCLRRRDYDQMIQIIERIPEDRRNTALQTLLEQAREKIDEIAFLICEIDEADRLGDRQTALKKAEELLTIKPGHHRARAIQEKYSGYGKGGAARIALVSQFTRPWSDGGWIPWSVLAFGLAVFAGMYGVIVIWLGKTAIVVDIKDPGVEVAVKGTTLTVTGPDKQSVTVEPGDHELKITAAGFEATTGSFSLKRGETKTVAVSIVNKEVVARIENEILPTTAVHDEKASIPRAGGTAHSPPPTRARETQATATLPSTFMNGLGMEFVLVPKGKSWLGGGGSRPGAREVAIAHDFYLGKYEVTQEEWEKVTGLTPSSFSRTGRGKDKVKDISDAELKRFPVESVSWDDAQAFLERLNRREQESEWVYRLPTETEWEYACRGGPLSDRFESAYDYYLDTPTNQLSPKQANFGYRPNGQTCKVGSYRPNRLGLYDMHGNVFEWCDDAETAPEGAPLHVTRGGCWVSPYGRGGSPPWACTAAYRWARPPSTREDRLGLRVARIPVGKEIAAEKTSPTVRKNTNVNESASQSPAVTTDGLIPLFNGRDLTGWATSPGRPGRWRVENGILKGSGPTASYLFTERKDFKDFELHVEARVNDGGNSGVYFRAPSDFSEEWPSGYEAQINSTHKDPHKTGSLYKNPGGIAVGVSPSPTGPDEWFQMDVIAIGNLITIKINGVVTANYADRERPFAAGRIGLQQHDPQTVVEFRKIEIKALTAPAASTPIPTNNPDRRAALAILGLGGSVTILMNDQSRDVRPGQSLPDEPFLLTAIRLHDKPQVRDSDLEPLEGIANLRHFSLNKVPNVTDAIIVHLRNSGQLESFWFEHAAVGDTGLAYLEEFTALKSLGLRGTHVSDAGMAHLEPLRQLEHLALGGTRITSAGLVHLEGLSRLAKLWLERTKISDSGLVHLERLSNLKGLILFGTQVTGAGLVHLKGLTQLEHLMLGGLRVTNSDLASLEGLTSLKTLWLDKTRVTDAGLVHLERLPHLEQLILRHTSVSDAGLEKLKGMAGLTMLNVVNTKVTAAGVAQLKKSLPQCEIELIPAPRK